MEKANAVVIGCGCIGPIHADALCKAEFGQLYGVCDIIQERADRFAEMYKCKSFYSFEDVLADKQVDCVHICTPHYLHAEMAIKAALAGKNIVLEKPVAMDLEQAKTVVDAVKMANVRCCAILQNRLNPCIEKAIEIINSGQMGKMLGIKAFLTWRRTKEYYLSEPWRGKWETEGGGLLINQAVHLLDLLCHLGGEIESVKANIDTRVLTEIEVEDTADATMFYKDGKIGHFYATNCNSEDSPFFIEMHFENGLLRYMDGTLFLKNQKRIEVLENDSVNAMGKAYWGCGHVMLIGNFYKKENYTTLDDAMKSMAVLDAVYLSAKTRNSKGE